MSRESLHSWLTRNPDTSAVIMLLLLAMLTRMLGIGHPASAVFDEVHFNYFAGFYYTGQYYYDIHPPLGKLLIALAAFPFGGIQPDDIVRTISTPFPDNTYMAMRLLPALFGSLLPALLFLVARQLNIGSRAALAAGALALVDNALIIQSRLILLDAMLLGFGFLSLWLFLKARKTDNLGLWCLSAFFAGCSFSVKWIGVSFIGLIGLTILLDWGRGMWRHGWTLTPFYRGSLYLIIAVATYATTFFIHFSLLPLSHQQGDQFMTPEFRATLRGSEYYGASGTVKQFRCPPGYKHQLAYRTPNTKVTSAENLACQIEYEDLVPPNFWRKLVELNRTMYATNQGLAKTHPDASEWYTWPIMHKPLYYWHHEGARIYLLGNPTVWWLCALGVIAVLVGQIKFTHWRHDEAFWVLTTGFWASLLPFMMVSRVMFMYHYLTSLCFSILLTGYLLDQLTRPGGLRSGALTLAAASFLLLSPITYGLNWYGSDLLWLLRFFGWHP